MQDTEKANTCLIFGEFTGEPGVHERLIRAVQTLVQEHGVRHFIVGPGDDFDWVAAQAVVRLLPQVGHVILYEPFPHGWMYDAVTDIRRRAAAGKLTLWDVPFPA